MLLSEAPTVSLLPLLCGHLHGRAFCLYLKSLGMYSCCGESSWEPSLCVGVRVCVSLPELLCEDKSNDVINGETGRLCYYESLLQRQIAFHSFNFFLNQGAFCCAQECVRG